MRQATVTRNTLETQITVSLNLDGDGRSRFATGVPFLEHMLDQIARHGLIDLDIEAIGDLHIDAHHTVEDIGITLDQITNRPVLRGSGLGLLLIGRRIAALHDLGALDGGDAARIGQADVGIAADGEFASTSTMAVAKDPTCRAAGR